jgi:antitoxin component YwqK of YwqJK toxin-antitoxin module
LGKVFNGEGYWKLYNANKQVSKDGTFSKSRLVDGKVYFYSSDGILTRIAVYKDGKYVGDAVVEE